MSRAGALLLEIDGKTTLLSKEAIAAGRTSESTRLVDRAADQRPVFFM